MVCTMLGHDLCASPATVGVWGGPQRRTSAAAKRGIGRAVFGDRSGGCYEMLQNVTETPPPAARQRVEQ